MNHKITNLRFELMQIVNFRGHCDIQIVKYRHLLEQILARPATEFVHYLKVFIEVLLTQNNVLIVTRQMLNDVIIQICKLPDEISIELSDFTVDKLQLFNITFEELIDILRRNLVCLYERAEEWRNAADVLIAIPLEGGPREYTKKYKAETYCKIAQLLVKCNDGPKAQIYLARAVFNYPERNLSILLCQCEVFELLSNYNEAATKYYELSLGTDRDVAITALRKAFVCTVLSPVGQKRTRLILALLRDKRCLKLPGYTLLEKMQRLRIIRRNDLKEVVKLLEPKNGSYILDYVICEHNMIAICRLYKNVTLAGLGALLGTTTDRAEQIAAVMIAEGRLEAVIDQPSRSIILKREEVVLPEQWEQQIQTVCINVGVLVDKNGWIAQNNPHY